MRSTLPNTGSCAGLEPMKECSVIQHASASQRMVSQIFVGQPRFNQLRNWSPPPQHMQEMYPLYRRNILVLLQLRECRLSLGWVEAVGRRRNTLISKSIQIPPPI